MAIKRMIGGQGVLSTRNWSARAGLFDLASRTSISVLDTLVESISATPTDQMGIAISPDGEQIFVAVNIAPRVLVYDYPTEDLIDPWPAPLHDDPTIIRFSPDGSLIAMGFPTTPYIKMFSYPGFVDQGVFTDLPTAAINELHFSPDGTKIVTVGDNTPFIHVHSVSTRASVAPTFTNAPTADCDCMAMSPVGDLIWVGGPDTGANSSVFNYVTGARVFFDTQDSYRAAFNSDGTLCYVIENSLDNVEVYDTSDWSSTTIDYSAWGTTVPAQSINNVADIRSLIAIGTDHLFIHGEGCSFLLDLTNEDIPGYVLNFELDVGKAVLHPDTEIAYVSGSVTEIGTGDPLVRKVEVYHEETNLFMGEGVSDAITGDYTIKVFNTDPVYVVCVGEGGEVTKIVGSVTPSLTP